MPVRRIGIWAVGVLSLVVTASPAYAQSGDPSKSGDLTGNFSGIVYLLIPLALGLALLTCIALGSVGTPSAAERRAGGVSRALSRRDAQAADPSL